jgi:hypothetical protein
MGRDSRQEHPAGTIKLASMTSAGAGIVSAAGETWRPGGLVTSRAAGEQYRCCVFLRSALTRESNGGGTACHHKTVCRGGKNLGHISNQPGLFLRLLPSPVGVARDARRQPATSVSLSLHSAAVTLLASSNPLRLCVSPLSSPPIAPRHF